MDESLEGTEDAPGVGLAIVLLILISLVAIAGAYLADAPGMASLPVLVGVGVNLGLAALLYAHPRVWVGVVVILRALIGGGWQLLQAFELRDMWGEWWHNSTVMGMLLFGAALDVVIVVALFLPSSMRALQAHRQPASIE